MKQSESYDRSIHRTGRLGSILAIAWMLGIPAVMCTVYHMFPSIPDLLLFGSGLLALYVPTAISEVITYVPMLGSASYITFITGNISNLKLPCALNALEMADVEQNTDAGDAVATVAVAVSSIVTTVIIVLGVLLLVPLQPILESEPVKIAGSYMLPALYGCLFLSQMTSKAGGTVIKGKLKAAVLPGVLVFLIHVFVTPVNRGIAILTFHAGTGGTEAQDWAEMLYRMYNKWASNHGMTVEVLDYQDGDEAGMKSASMMVKGANAYGLLKSENGVHRLVRVSPFDANARRQTSFASLEVMPELDNTIQVDIRPEDIEMQVYRSSGAGGQHINKTSSAVRLIHKPTGVVVSCQTQRSQFQNRDYAMEMLKAKLYQIAKQQHMDKIDDIKGVQNEIAWGHQIRSYVFMPYTMVKDHRTNYETGNVDAVMDGDLDGFIFAYLKAASRGELQDT